MSAYLKYIGNGSYLPDVPARDLTEDEATYHGEGRLLDSRLYERVREKPAEKEHVKKAVKAKEE